MTAAPNAPQDWNECPPGEIGGLVESLQSRRRRKTLQQAAGASATVVVFAFLVTGWFSGWFPQSQPLHAISCQKVHSLAPEYVAGRLNADLNVKIREHLQECQRCRDFIHAEFPRFPLPAHAAASLSVPWIVAVANR